MFRPLPNQVDLPAMEHAVLARWRERDVFRRSLERTTGGRLWSFYEGPPTANGRPGTHHVEARVFKDLYPRFKTMKGWHVPRRAGWDCHGLPVELEVEKELGFSGKQDIERYGIAEFNARCRESVQRHVDEFVRMTERMGYWVDFADAYWTMDPAYIQSVWWSLKAIFDKGLLVEDHRVTPYCPRCGTGLSDHEVAQGYYQVRDPSVYVRLPVTTGPLADRRVALLVWTTTPWTLVSNTAVVVRPDVTYVVARVNDELLVVAEPLLGRVLGDGAEVVERLPGGALEHARYSPPFDLVEIPDAHYVGLADYVTVDDGTGLVHQAPAFGAEDLAVARRYGLPVVNPIRPDGTFDPALPLVGGKFFKAADEAIVADLDRRGLLFRVETYEHSYPHCWRCDTPLVYYALPSWFIRTTAVKDRLVEENEQTNWYPDTIKRGRYGDWLTNNVDWALSRRRYWGTPLPVWRCPDGHLTCVGSLAELSELTGRDLAGLDPHRPYVDEVRFACRCGGEAVRVADTIDGWYDSGSMPFAQFGYPRQHDAEFDAAYPADFIAEAIDQTRGWFYTLMAVGTLVFDRSAYRTVLCLGLIVDEQGRKMSKHLGNVLDPFELFERHGADAVRWLMLCVGNPWSTRRVGHALLDEVVRKVVLTYWNTVSFLLLYANANGWTPGGDAGPVALLDRWIRSELNDTVDEVDRALEAFDSVLAGRRLSGFLDDLSNWYVRRSRRRFWDGDPAALATLYECLDVLTRLLAPFMPFVTDEMHERLVHDLDPQAADSVHLRDWPTADRTLVDAELAGQVRVARRLVELGRAARAAAGVRTRQPLGRALVGAPGWEGLPAELREHVAAELNVVAVESVGGHTELVDHAVKPNFRALGRRFGAGTPAVADALTGMDPAEVAASLRTTGQVTVPTATPVQLTADEVLVAETPRTGWAVESEGGLSVALDLTLSDELRRAGRLREAVRLVQEARKTAGLQVSDRIELWWTASDPLTAAALRAGTELLAGEVLATRVSEGTPTAPLAGHTDAELELRFWLRAVD
jgi:isoleucyl-tRNA synthetase